MGKTTDQLDKVLKSASPDSADEYLQKYSELLFDGKTPFASYMRMCIRENGIQQQEVFLNADVSESYGYKIISEEKRTRQRDTILRLCFGAKMSLQQIQRALKIYGMSPLYARVPRDAVLIMAINREIYEISEINRLLAESSMLPLKGTIS